MRADEHGWENYGNAMVMQLAGALDATGRVIGWDYAGWSVRKGKPSRTSRKRPDRCARRLP
jgi:hypothetical protein